MDTSTFMPRSGSSSAGKNLNLRRYDDATAPVLTKKLRLAPVFVPRAAAFRWLTPLALTCLRGIHLAPPVHPRTKVAAFDLDGTLIKWLGFGVRRFEWMSPDVPLRLRALCDDGYTIAIFTNQMLGWRNLEKFKDKVPLIARAIHDVPFYVFASTARDGFRKPLVGMWDMLEEHLGGIGSHVDLEEAFFVGDAAGRPGDYSAADKGFAETVGLRFYTPEEYFELPEKEPIPPAQGATPHEPQSGSADAHVLLAASEDTADAIAARIADTYVDEAAGAPIEPLRAGVASELTGVEDAQVRVVAAGGGL